MPHRIHGVWAASVTPLNADLSIDHAKFAAHITQLLSRGNHGVAVFGSTGEGNSFTAAERIEAVSRLAAAGIPMDRILVGTGACAYPDAVSMSRAAHDLGALGVLFHPPFYYKEPSDAGMLAYFERFVSGVGGDLRVVLYHFPRLVGVGYSPELVARLLAAFPEQMVGIKDSSGDLDRMVSLARAHPEFAVLAGNEKLLLPVLEAGGAGCLTATTNLTAPLARRVYESRSAELQAELSAARTALETAPFISGIKRLLADRDDDEGWVRVRPPQQALSLERTEALRDAYRS